MTAEDEVQQASDQFYTALNHFLNGGDRWLLAATWSHSPAVTTLHPVGGRQVGWPEVWRVWEQLYQLFSGGQISARDVVVRVLGDVAYTVGIERGEGTLGDQAVRFDYRVTHLYQREAGAWKLIHRHADAAPVLQDVFGRLQSASG